MTDSSTASQSTAALPFRFLAGPALFVAACAASVHFFWLGIVSLVDAWATPEYSHGPIIPLISTFLFLREMRGVPPVEHAIRDRWPGVVVALLGLAIGAAGNITLIGDIVTYGMIVWIAGMALTCFGFRRGVLFWPAIIHLMFMLPLPQIVYWQVSSYLQTVSSQLGVGVISLIGIPVYLDGNIIDLGTYKLQVAEACSGLRYLFPMLSFSYVFAVLYQGPLWHKAVLLLAAAPITVAMNSFRIGMIGVLVDNFGIGHAEGFLHAFEGWVIFLACVLILFGLTMVMQRLSGSRQSLSEALDIEFSGLGGQMARAGSIAPSAALAAIVAITAAATTAAMLAPERRVQYVERAPFVLFPRDLGNWNGRLNPLLDPTIERVLAADDYLSMSFVSNDAGDAVDLFVAYYHDQMDGTGIHSPEVCIPSGGWEVSDWRPVTVTDVQGAPVEANRAVIQKGAARQLVYYWFELRGRRLSSDYGAKFVNMRDSMLIGRSDGALVRVITPMRPGEAEAEADARLGAFIGTLSTVIGEHVPN